MPFGDMEHPWGHHPPWLQSASPMVRRFKQRTRHSYGTRDINNSRRHRSHAPVAALLPTPVDQPCRTGGIVRIVHKLHGWQVQSAPFGACLRGLPVGKVPRRRWSLGVLAVPVGNF